MHHIYLGIGVRTFTHVMPGKCGKLLHPACVCRSLSFKLLKKVVHLSWTVWLFSSSHLSVFIWFSSWFVPCCSSKVPSALPSALILHTSKTVPPPVTPAHHFWSLWPGPQTQLLLLSLCPEEVASWAHTATGLSERSFKGHTAPSPALLRRLDWPAKERRAGWCACQYPPHPCYCAKCWTDERGRNRWKGQEGRGGDCVICWQVRPWIILHIYPVIGPTDSCNITTAISLKSLFWKVPSCSDPWA